MEQQTKNTNDHRIVGYDSLRRHHAKRASQHQSVRQENKSPNVGSFSKSTGEPSSRLSRSEENASESATASVDRHFVSSFKKNVQTGPLKKRSPKLSASKKRCLGSPVLTPTKTATRPPGLLRFQTSDFSNLSASSSVFRRKLTPSCLKNEREAILYQHSVRRNLNNELMKEAMLTTPKHFSVKLSNNTVFSNPKQLPLISRLTPFSSSKKRKAFHPVVTNVSKYDQASSFVPSRAAHVDATPRTLDGDHVHNQILGTTNAGSTSSPSKNVLRIIHPFGNNPRVTIKRIGGESDHLDNYIHKKAAKTKDTKIERDTKSRLQNGRTPNNTLFSPILRHPKISCNLSPDDGKSTSRPSVKSKPTKAENKAKGRSKRKSKELSERAKLFKNVPLRRPDLFQNVRTTKDPCKCKKTHCLKLYCECFHNNLFCDPNLCSCQDCMNTETHNSADKPRGPRVLAMLAAMDKKPDSFDGGGRKFNRKGCGCSKSR